MLIVCEPALAQAGSGIAADGEGRLFFVDLSRERIWRWEPGDDLLTVAHGKYQDFVAAGADGTAFLIHRALPIEMRWLIHTIGRDGGVTEIERSSPIPISSAITIDSSGTIYYRRFTELISLSPEGKASAWARPVTVDSPGYGVLGPDGGLYFVDSNAVKVARPGEGVHTIAGSAAEGYADGAGEAARFYRPMGLAVDSTGTLYVADYGNQRIRLITPDGTVSTIARSRWLWRPAGVAVSGSDIFVLERAGDYYGRWVLPLTMYSFVSDLAGTPRIRRIDLDGSMTTVVTVRRYTTLVVLGLGLIGGFWGGILWLKKQAARGA